MKKCVMFATLQIISTYTRCFFGKNRQKSIEDGCCVYLCGKHHNQSNLGVHFNKELDNMLKQQTEIAWMKKYNKTTDDFIKRFGKNYV